MIRFSMIACAGVLAATAAVAQDGPVATACKEDAAKYCAGKEHGNRELRTCLEENKSKVSATCRAALDSTGRGQGQGQGQGKKSN
jgi:hypothetical protein